MVEFVQSHGVIKCLVPEVKTVAYFIEILDHITTSFKNLLGISKRFVA